MIDEGSSHPPSRNVRQAANSLTSGYLPALAALGLALCVPTLASPAQAEEARPKRGEATAARKPAAAPPAKEEEAPAPLSEGARRVVEWVVDSGDNNKLPFIVIDKPQARMLVFAADGEQLGEAPVLLGVGIGDDATPGVGDKPLAEIGPAERTTPAGRYLAKYGRAKGRQQVLWVDWYTSVALHPVITTNRKEQRQKRLDTPDVDDNRISFGCINVPVKFYREEVRPLFRKAGGMVYILPDLKSVEEVFPRLLLQQYKDAPPLPLPPTVPEIELEEVSLDDEV